MECVKCHKIFKNLEKHINRKIPCDRIFKCPKCGKKFNTKYNYNRHINRKTSCEPVAGDPTQVTPPNTCHYCYRKFSHKQSLIHHFNTCKIKNGGIELLFKKIEDLTSEVKGLKGGNNSITVNNMDSNHHNTNINLNLIKYGSNTHNETVDSILSKCLPLIITQPYDEGRSKQEQVKERIQLIITSLYRNPDHKGLQNIYVIPEREESNAFIYNGSGGDKNCKEWQVGNWNAVGKSILSKVWIYADRNKTVKKKGDVLNVMKHMFSLAGLGKSAVDNMSDNNIKELWTDIGKKLKYKTIIE